MNKIHMLLRVLHHAERIAARKLLVIGERHKSDHEVYHVTRDMAGWSHRHIRLLAEQGDRLGINLRDTTGRSRPLRVVRERTAELLGHRPESGLLLLRDLRKLHLDLVGLSVDWEILGQTAQGAKDDELLALTQKCHPDVLRQARWANNMIKVVSPQEMAS
ncbi:hypothetical protein G1H11_15260 [Phytoactinopolyspora alkaliphila]|uniref:Uncharacterized protein n=1 Tax=Phytoactinopolyspora alkaliphila TaxID=1783498 RepID=A0A6N9YNZ2_9ACTN|nr:hypothetical protein [Phytoactinopolyspora alkaliphila]NED96667.1 hypothetical protein [Phytoactinopolyspora alkaliphila]